MNHFYKYINYQLIFNNKVVKRSNFEKENDREIRDVPSPSPVPESIVGKVSHSEIRTKNEENVDFKPNSKCRIIDIIMVIRV